MKKLISMAVAVIAVAGALSTKASAKTVITYTLGGQPSSLVEINRVCTGGAVVCGHKYLDGGNPIQTYFKIN